jgi:hypothetical protein
MLEVRSSRNLSATQLPQSLHPSSIPPALGALENGVFDHIFPLGTTQFPGGCTVATYRTEDSPVHVSVADVSGRFPESGKVAVNAWCMEKITLLDGELTFEINGNPITLAKGDFVVLAAGDSYAASGSGRFVATADTGQGTTILATQFPEPAGPPSREEVVIRSFLRLLMTGDRKSSFAGAEELVALAVDPRTVPLEMVTGSRDVDHEPQLKIEKLQMVPVPTRTMTKLCILCMKVN